MRIVIAGCGRLGAELAMRLNGAGHTVAVIDPDREAFDRLDESYRGRTIDGLGFDLKALQRAAIQSADAFAAVTSDDSSNAIMARIARIRYHVPRVVARLYDTRHALLYEVLGIQTASTVSWGVDRLEQLLSAPEMTSVHRIGNGDVEIVDLYLPADLVGRTTEELEGCGELTVVGLTRGGLTSLPSPAMQLQNGDLLHLGIQRGTLADWQRKLGCKDQEVA